MPGSEQGEGGGSTAEEKSSSYWNLLPSFDPATDDVREFIQKARFLNGVIPQKDKANLAPRLAMQCKGTAWSQMRQLDPSKLVVPDKGLDYLIEALSAWEETSEMKTYELFEKAMYRVVQKSDETTTSYTLRLRSAFDDLGEVTLAKMQAFILLRQSGLSNEDKKKVLTMTGGTLDLVKVEGAMRALSTKVLLGTGETRKKVYPTNYVEPDEPQGQEEENTHSTYFAQQDDDEIYAAESIDQLVQQGDEDAMMIQQFENDFTEMMQEVPDLQQALVSYQEARQRISDVELVDSGHRETKGKVVPTTTTKEEKEKGTTKVAKMSSWPRSVALTARFAVLWDTGRQSVPRRMRQLLVIRSTWPPPTWTTS